MESYGILMEFDFSMEFEQFVSTTAEYFIVCDWLHNFL